MKKKLFLMACLAVVGILRVKAQQSIIALHHEGNVTIYAGAKTQEAMDASVKGDTLYLSEGTFSGFNVTHGIVVLGSGEKTVVSGNITITGNEEKKDLGGYVFSGMNLLYDIIVNDSVNGLRISQCQMRNFEVIDDAKTNLDNAEIVMCYIRGGLIAGGSEESLTVVSSKIWTVRWGGNTDGAITFNHCNVYYAQDDETFSESDTRNIYSNCIIFQALGSTVMNSIIKQVYSKYSNNRGLKGNIENTFVNNISFDDKMNCSLTDDSLHKAGYFGNDGTVVGITGGDIPYTLELAAPHVVDHKVDVDNVNRKMTVTLKMAHEATKEEE